MPDLALLVNMLQLAVKDRTQLALENIALRHQLARSVPSLGRAPVVPQKAAEALLAANLAP